SIRKLVELICRKMEVDFEEFVEVAPDRLGKDAAYSMDSSKIRRELGWRDRVPLEEGIDRVIQWVDSYFNDLKEQPQQYIHKP
ncbi:MAG: dTDP-glucose 4,6-dehydratase, partial [Nitrospinaceae bacterium]